MVSIEENSSDFDEAVRALSGTSPSVLSAALAASWLKPNTAPQAYGAEESAALAFLRDDDETQAPATLVVNNVTHAHDDAASTSSKPHGAEALITEKDINKIAGEVMQRCMAAGVPPSEIDKLIATLKSNVGASKSSLEEIRGEALRAADDLVSEATSKASETPEMKAERILQEAIKAEEKAQAESHEFDPYKTKDELAKEKEAEEKFNEAKEEYKRLKAIGATEAELEAVRKRMIGYQKVLSEVRNDTYERIGNDQNLPNEIREKAKHAQANSAGYDKQWQEAADTVQQDKRTNSEVVRGTEAVRTKVKRDEIALAKSENIIASADSLLDHLLVESPQQLQSKPSVKPTTLAHTEVGVLEATSAAPNVQGGGKAANIGIIKT